MPSPFLNEEQAKKQVKASLGNKWAVGLKTRKAQLAAFESYCKHLSNGRSKRSWFYRDKEGNHCCFETMENLIVNKVFEDHFVKDAEAKRFSFWEEMGISMARGDIKGSPITWMAVMKNSFQWDRQDYAKLEDNDKELILRIQKFSSKDGD